MSLEYMSILDRVMGRWRPRRQRYALALAGGGVIGGMYEVGVITAIEERLNGNSGFDIYVGCSAGSVVASLLANGVRASEIYRVIDQDLEHPLNFRRGAVYASNSFRHAAGRFGRLLWAVGKNAMTGMRQSVPDMLAAAERDLPSGFFSLTALEIYLRETFAAFGLKNSFTALDRELLIPAIDLDRAQRVVFGRDGLRDVAISEAVAASSAIPGFFEPYTLGGRDYVDGGVGFSGHADLAAEAGADVVLVVNPLVPNPDGGVVPLRNRGLYTIMEQAGRIYSQNLLQLGLSTLRIKHPRTEFHLIQPGREETPLFGPSMGFEASRAALRYGYESTREWLDGQGTGLLRRLQALPQPAV
ncbi:MAG TPA: patatin-like phospholipase family protein [Methylomirabilota bacterium]|jgi:NTE family protein|nr:patatin-like phospholipase family protein [Methylomirabilota bacterium]